MEKINISLYEWMEDFDDQSVSKTQRKIELMKAVDAYNFINKTSYNNIAYYYNYLSWQRDKIDK